MCPRGQFHSSCKSSDAIFKDEYRCCCTYHSFLLLTVCTICLSWFLILRYVFCRRNNHFSYLVKQTPLSNTQPLHLQRICEFNICGIVICMHCIDPDWTVFCTQLCESKFRTGNWIYHCQLILESWLCILLINIKAFANVICFWSLPWSHYLPLPLEASALFGTSNHPLHIKTERLLLLE